MALFTNNAQWHRVNPLVSEYSAQTDMAAPAVGERSSSMQRVKFPPFNMAQRISLSLLPHFSPT